MLAGWPTGPCAGRSRTAGRQSSPREEPQRAVRLLAQPDPRRPRRPAAAVRHRWRARAGARGAKIGCRRDCDRAPSRGGQAAGPACEVAQRARAAAHLHQGDPVASASARRTSTPGRRSTPRTSALTLTAYQQPVDEVDVRVAPREEQRAVAGRLSAERVRGGVRRRRTHSVSTIRPARARARCSRTRTRPIRKRRERFGVGGQLGAPQAAQAQRSRRARCSGGHDATPPSRVRNPRARRRRPRASPPRAGPRRRPATRRGRRRAGSGNRR